jgi:hypothetical protein
MYVARRLVLLGCFLVSALGAPAVRAGGGGTIEGGTITFVGAIVEPTCSVATAPGTLSLAGRAAPVHPGLQQSCAGSTAAGEPASASRPHEVDVVHLSASESDRVLRYFANYVRVAQPGSADPMLVTQTYE